MNISDVLSRTNLSITLNQFLDTLPEIYPTIGDLQEYQVVFEGYENANIILTTTNGKYVLKIFAYDIPRNFIDDYVKVVKQASNIGVNTLEIVPGQQGYISSYQKTYFIITNFFERTNFQNSTPTMDDILFVTESISKLNTLNLEIKGIYDHWGNNNLLKEYSKTKVKDGDILSSISPLIDFLQKKDLSDFSKALIHGDMQRKHVLKNKSKYCILDFGCMRYDLKVYEISTLLAWFCLSDDTWYKKDKIFEKVISKYMETHRLSEEEIKMIKPLIAASYASYLLQSTYLIENGDNSTETLGWNTRAREMYMKCMDWINL